MQCNAMQCNAMQCNALNAMPLLVKKKRPKIIIIIISTVLYTSARPEIHPISSFTLRWFSRSMESL